MKDRLPIDSAKTALLGVAWRTVWSTFLAAALALLGTSALAALAAGCADQGEGERCTYFSNSGDASVNGTDECSSGLVCQSAAAALTAPTCNGGACRGTLGVCCPPPGVASTVAACRTTTSGSTTGGQPTGDGSTPSETGTDGHAADSATEGGHTDGRTDGHVDASSDGASKSDATTDGATGTPGTTDASKDGSAG